MEASNSQHIKSMQNSEHDQNVYQEDTNISLSQGNYVESPQNIGKTISMSGYYTIPHEGDRSMDANNIPYIIPDGTESRIPIDPTTMQATAALNQSLMYQNHGLPADYPYQMFNGMNSMYGGIPQYYGGMNMPMNPYYDPYGLINPLSCSPVNTEKTKKKVKRFYCC
ncbi:conserved Plasmodium protein, unknown function [Plasmodium vinckei vinckei]|uniref:Uncharacterized protein n=1 Tax=Plasmodium vinckei vinckei TaxID=54757 RepID=A0A449BSX5_PLAVN|nr:conserved Plasmodium protein, unknown function [Plasmodium vinckei vinckei]KEG02332.1 hypothetical protein YYE_03071 [Plasmodium vinckei vinckei]VEV56577.1 conserved Plasmodium protein, unknown function [Plasmodium vinckei vinckei]